MIVRTAPVVLPDADAIRALERLESQLRRAADDLAVTLGAMRDAIAEPVIEVPIEQEWHGRKPCGEWMPNAKQFCGRFEGHADSHRSRAVMDEEARRRRAAR